MKKKKCVGIMALVPLAVCNFAVMPVSAEVTDYQETAAGMEETSAECQVIYKSTYDFSEEIPKYPELEVSVSGYEGIYDGKPHGITVGCKTEGAVILYSTDGKTYADKKPVFTDTGTYLTYYKVEKEGYQAVTGTAPVRITEAEIDYSAHDYNGSYDGKKHSIDLSVKTNGCKILYSDDGINFTSKKPEYKEPGTYVVYYRIEKENYAAVTGSATVAIREKDGAAGDNKNSNSQSSRFQDSGNKGGGSLDGNADASPSRVQTGDENNILLYGVMFLASAFGLLKNKRRKEREKL